MFEYLRSLLSSDGFMPHGMCYLWRPGILSLHVISDALITLAYFSIPFTLLYFVRRRRDLEFNWMFVCFAIFIVACGTTHLMEIWTVWEPRYWLSGAIKAVTAMASVPTAILLVKLVPQALQLPSPSELREANEQLEARVAERTAQLEAANRSLRENQRLLEAIIDGSTTVIYVKDLEGRYILVNRRFEEIFSVARAQVVGHTDHDLFSKTAADAFRAMDVRVATADQALMEEEIAPQIDGPHVYLSVKAPLRDDGGKTYAIFGISTDISERRKAEELQRAQLERLSLLDRITRAIGERQDLRSILGVVTGSLEEHLPVDHACAGSYDDVESALTVVSTGTRLEMDSVMLERCRRGELMYEPDAATSTSALCEHFVRRGLRSVVIAPLLVETRMFGALLCARTAPNGFSSGDCEFVRQLSQHVALAANQAQLYDSLQSAYDDLRQTQQSVMQHERLRALGQMASGIAHDINNALSPASLFVQLLLESTPESSGQGRERLVIVQQAIDSVANTVARMREFYRPPEAQATLSPVSVNVVAQQVLDLTRVRWSDMPQERGIVIEVRQELEGNLAPVPGRPSEIRDAITNLVLNAVDAMPNGGLLTLRSYSIVSTQKIALEVCDTGVGMDEETRGRCLEPFYTTKGQQGTGLGLAMVYGMAQRHNAELQIESQPNRGTTMRLVFPVAQFDGAAQLDKPPALPRKLRILLVDDDPVLLETLREVLQADGHEVAAAPGGQAGIAAFSTAHRSALPFELVVTDLGMPHVDGRAVAAAIKSLAPATPVVLLTGWGNRGLGESPGLQHVDRILTKPPRLAELRQVLLSLT